MESKLRTLQANLSTFDCRQISDLAENDEMLSSFSIYQTDITPLTDKEQHFLIQKANESSSALIQHSHTLSGPELWQYIGKYRGITMYRGEAPITIENPAPSYTRQFVCGVMTIVGSIEDVATYFDQSTTAEMKIKQADDIMDCKVLYSLINGPDDQPFHRVAVKYVAWEAPAALSHTRDLCYLECQNIFKHSSGRRGWVLSMHSVDIQTCPPRMGMVRCSMYNSGYVFVESERPGYLHVLHTLQINFKGHLPHFVVNQALRKRVASMTGVRDELLFLRLSRKRLLQPEELVPKHLRIVCGGCAKRFSKVFLRKTRCRVCGEVLCQKCAPILNFKDLDEPVNKQQSVKLRICNQCLRESMCVEKSKLAAEYHVKPCAKQLQNEQQHTKGINSWSNKVYYINPERHASTVLEEDEFSVQHCTNNVFDPQIQDRSHRIPHDDNMIHTFIMSADSEEHRKTQGHINHRKERSHSSRSNQSRTSSRNSVVLENSTLKDDEKTRNSNLNIISNNEKTSSNNTAKAHKRSYSVNDKHTSFNFVWNRLSISKTFKSSFKNETLEAVRAKKDTCIQKMRSSFNLDKNSIFRRSMSNSILDAPSLIDGPQSEEALNARKRPQRRRSISYEHAPIPSCLESPINKSKLSISSLTGPNINSEAHSSEKGELSAQEDDDLEDVFGLQRKTSYESYQPDADECQSLLSDVQSIDMESVITGSYYREDNDDSFLLEDPIDPTSPKRRGSSFDYEDDEGYRNSYIEHGLETYETIFHSEMEKSIGNDSDLSENMEPWRDSESMRHAHQQHQNRMMELQRKLDILERQSFYGSSQGSVSIMSEME